MKHYGFPPAPFIGWIRIARPGSILGPQQQYLNQMDERMLKAGGEAKRKELISAFEDMNLGGGDRTYMDPDEARRQKEGDTGQGEHLTGAKRR